MAKENEKQHYRKVFKSDHLGIADLEDFIEEKVNLIFTIREVKQQYGVAVAGKKGDFNIAYFVEPIKPLVLNATNSKVVKSLAGGSPFVQDWKNILVELYIDSTVKMKGEIVGGVRIRAGSIALPVLNKTMAGTYANVLKYYRETGVFTEVEKKFILTDEIKQQIKDDAAI